MTKRLYSFLKLTGIYSISYWWMFKDWFFGIHSPSWLAGQFSEEGHYGGLYTLNGVPTSLSSFQKCNRLAETSSRTPWLCRRTWYCIPPLHCFPTFLESLRLTWFTCHFPSTHMVGMTPHSRQFHKKLYLERWRAVWFAMNLIEEQLVGKLNLWPWDC